MHAGTLKRNGFEMNFSRKLDSQIVALTNHELAIYTIRNYFLNVSVSVVKGKVAFRKELSLLIGCEYVRYENA